MAQTVSHSRPFWQDDSTSTHPAGNQVTMTNPLDDLFDHEVENNASTSAQADGARQISREDVDMSNTGLGIDEEVKVRKKRAPIAKLDEER